MPNEDLEPDILWEDSAIFLSPRQPDKALRRWYRSHLPRMAKTVRFFRELRTILTNRAEWTALVAVPEIHEEEGDWVLMDFDRSAIPIAEGGIVTEGPEARKVFELRQQTCNRLEQLLAEAKEPQLQTLRTMIRQQSKFVQWSFTTGRVLVLGLD